MNISSFIQFSMLTFYWNIPLIVNMFAILAQCDYTVRQCLFGVFQKLEQVY